MCTCVSSHHILTVFCSESVLTGGASKSSPSYSKYSTYVRVSERASERGIISEIKSEKEIS